MDSWRGLGSVLAVDQSIWRRPAAGLNRWRPLSILLRIGNDFGNLVNTGRGAILQPFRDVGGDRLCPAAKNIVGPLPLSRVEGRIPLWMRQPF